MPFSVPPLESAESPPYPVLSGRVQCRMKQDGTKANAEYFGTFGDIHVGYLDMGGTNVEVAVKVFRVQPENVEAIRRRLNREAFVWHDLNHPNVLKFLGLDFQTFDRPAIVSPHCINKTIMEYLRMHPGVDTLRMIKQVALGLNHLHQKKVVHGDLKPANILISDKGQPLLCDFGCSRIVTHRGFTTDFFATTPRFQAPELLTCMGKPCLTLESDVYAYALCAYEIWTGLQPFASIANVTNIVIQVAQFNLRPTFPEASLRGKERIWPLLESCWKAKPTERLTMDQVVNICHTL